MSDKDIKKSLGGKSQTEDSVFLKSGMSDTSFRDRQINPAQVVHTVGTDGIEIPDYSREENSDVVISRFIKANSTPFVSVSGGKEEENEAGFSVDKFTDRLAPKAPEKKTAPVSVKKGNSYSETHSLSPKKGRMIVTDGSGPDEKLISDEAEENRSHTKALPPLGEAAAVPLEESTASDPQTKKVISRGGAPEIGNIYDTAPTKTIPDPKGMLLREIAHSADEDVRRNPDQLMMDGFDSLGKDKAEEKVLEEQQLREELKKTRQKRISAFNFWSKKEQDEDTDSADEKFGGTDIGENLPEFLVRAQQKFAHLNTDFTPVSGGEYTDFNNRKEVFSDLIQSRKNVVLRLLAVGLLGAMLFIIDLVAGASANANPNGFFTVLGGNTALYSAINLVALLVCGALMAKDLKSGFFSLLKVHPKTDSSLLFLMLAALLQNILAFFTQLKPENSFRMLAPAAILMCVPYLLAKVFYYDSARHCFKAAAIKGDKSYLRRVSDEELVSGLLRDRENREQNIVYSGRIRFVDKFIARSAQSAKAGMPSSRSVLITAGVAFLVGIAVIIIKKDPVYAITSTALCLAFSLPVSCLTVNGFELARENRKLSVKSSFILSHADARDFSAIDNIIVKDSDIFTAEITNCLTAKSVSDRQAKFCAAVLTSKFGGPLNTALASSVSSLEDKFPAAENLVYEEKMGLSAWVSNCKVLLGTHTFLVNHNVQVPDEKQAAAFFGENEVPVYLAIEGRFAAVFAVKYSCKPNTPESLRQLVNNGSSILLSSFDANLSEEYAEKLLGMPPCSVRTVNSSLNDRLSTCMQGVKDSEDAGIVFTDSFESLCRCASSAIKLDRNKKITKLVCEAGAYVGLVLAGVLCLTGAYSSASPLLAVFVQLLWTALCFGVTYIFSATNIGVKLPSLKKPLSDKKNQEALQEELAQEAEYSPENGEQEPPVNSTEEAPSVSEAQPDEKSESTPVDEAEKTSQPNENMLLSREAEEKALSEKSGTVNQATFDALDAYAAEAEPKKPKESSPAPVSLTEATEEEEYDDGDAYDNGLSQGISALKEKAKGFMSGFVSRFTVENQDDEDEEVREDEETDSDVRPFAFLSPKEKKASPPQTQRKSVKGRLTESKAHSRNEGSEGLGSEEENRIKALFTPPEMPVAPSYDLSPAKEPEEDPLEAKFIPPEVTAPAFYSDEMFSRFEDDKIFSPLRESREQDSPRS